MPECWDIGYPVRCIFTISFRNDYFKQKLSEKYIICIYTLIVKFIAFSCKRKKKMRCRCFEVNKTPELE